MSQIPPPKKITNLRLYKPDGMKLEFVLGESSGEGKIAEITQWDDIFTVYYSDKQGKPKSEARFSGFPYAVRLVLIK